MTKSKKTTKKRAAKKAAVKRERQTAKYELAGELSDKVQSPQQLLIREAMQKLRGNFPPRRSPDPLKSSSYYALFQHPRDLSPTTALCLRAST